MKKHSLIQELFDKDKLFTLSNFLSFLRLAGAFFLYDVMVHKNLYLAMGIILFLIITDYADGYVARKLNQISEMGKVLDPLADKFCIAAGMVALYQSYNLPLWLLIITLGRDVLILIGSLVLITRLPYVTPSSMSGKIAVTMLSLLCISYFLEIKFSQPSLTILTVISIVISSIHYAYRFYIRIWPRKITEGEKV